MHIDIREIRELLQRVIRRLVSDVNLWEDLLQEALMHLWLIETRRPGQTRSWYVQSCKFHLLHYLASGRSIDSGKRRAGQIYFDVLAEEPDERAEQPDNGASVLSCVSARDLLGK